MTNNIHTFTAFDIEKYHKGQLSAKEMHALEKAALDDPFLADALEGYTSTGVNIVADLADLKNRLGNRIAEEEEKKVIPLKGARKPFPWFRAAAAVVIIAGAGLLANQFLFDKKNDQLAVADSKQDKKAEITAGKTDTGSVTPGKVASTTPVSGQEQPLTPTSNSGNKTAETPAKGNLATEEEKLRSDEAVTVTTLAKASEASKWKTDNTPVVEREDVKTTDGSVKNNMPATGGREKDLANSNQDLKKTAPGSAPVVFDDKEKTKSISASETAVTNQQNRNVAPARNTEEQGFLNQRSNIFRGRVTDANNVGVPFANVTNVEDRVGTYTDAYGNFNLTSPDSTLTVQVRSIGFENAQVQLRNNLPTNQVVMQDDRKNIAEVVISNQKPADAAARSRDANKVLQEPEPVVGWSNYNTYAANNLEIPDEIKSKQNTGGSVQVSFEVDKYGDPVKIKVEKSLCTKCDQEAIRLIKEGPKWKRASNKKGRTTVTINF